MVKDWVKQGAGRLSDMGRQKISLRVQETGDGDVELYIEADGELIEDKNGNCAYVEFSTYSGGGGVSPKTHAAVLALITAMIEDHRFRPEGTPQYPVWLREEMEKEKFIP